MSLGVPQLANVFYYGKDFSSKKQKLTKEGRVSEEKYRPLSVSKPGALGEILEEREIAAREKTKENESDDVLDQFFAQDEQGTTVDDLMKIIGKG